MNGILSLRDQTASLSPRARPLQFLPHRWRCSTADDADGRRLGPVKHICEHQRNLWFSPADSRLATRARNLERSCVRPHTEQLPKNGAAFPSMPIPIRLLLIALVLITARIPVSASNAVDGFQPPSAYLEIRYPEYGGGPLQLYSAGEFSSIAELYKEKTSRVIWTLAAPPTIATKTVVAGLFLLALRNGTWVVLDAKRFESAGKYSDANATLTSQGTPSPHITVVLHQGGRGGAWEETSSYDVKDGKFILALPVEKMIGLSGTGS